MSNNESSRLDDLALSLREIVPRFYPTAPRQKPHHIRFVVGVDQVDEQDCAADENIVTVSASGTRFWYRPYSEPGAPRFAHDRIGGLMDFMEIVIWPRMVGEWASERLLAEARLSEAEHAAVEENRRLQDEGKALNLRDIDQLLGDWPWLRRLYGAICHHDAAALAEQVQAPSDDLREIGLENVQAFQSALAAGNEDGMKNLHRYILFRALQIAAQPLMAAGRYDWLSPDYHENARQFSEQVKRVGALARSRYAAEFRAICLSNELVAIEQRLFGAGAPFDLKAYTDRVEAFVGGQLASR